MVAIECPVTKRFVGGMRAEALICQDVAGQESMRKERSGKTRVNIAGIEGFVYLYRHVDLYFCGLFRNI